MSKSGLSSFPALSSLLSRKFLFEGKTLEGWWKQEGPNREQQKFNQLGAENDLQAVRQFLNTVRDTAHTSRTYSREIERFLLWLLLERRKTLSTFTLEDFIAYEAFLVNPDASWCGRQGVKQATWEGNFNQKWRPFSGPLSPNSQKLAIASINSMMSFLVAAHYLSVNPLLLDKKYRQKLARKASQESFHAFSHQEWQWIWKVLEALPQHTAGEKNQYERLHFILTMFYCTACRIGEFSSHLMNSFRQHANGRWFWHVAGKGDKLAMLPVNQVLLDALIRYRKHLGLLSLPDKDDRTPLLLNKKGTRAITSRQLSRLLSAFFNQVAENIEQESSPSAENIRKATAHWLRHTALSHAAQRSQDIRLVQRFGRHEHIQTSMLYVHVEDEELDTLMAGQTPWQLE